MGAMVVAQLTSLGCWKTQRPLSVKALLQTVKGSTKIRWFYSSFFTDEDTEAKREWLWEKEITCGVKKSECKSQPLACWVTVWMTLDSVHCPGISITGYSEGGRMLCRNVCVAIGPQEAFSKCLLAKQELH